MLVMACSSSEPVGSSLPTSSGTGTSSGAGGNTGSTSSLTGSTTSGIGGGLSSSSSGSGGAPPDCGSDLTGLIRDFKQSHPDFEYTIGNDLGIVTPALGPDGKPVYAGNPNTPTTTGKANFDQWYRDVQDVNQKSELAIPLTDVGNGFFVYESNAFFPIDDKSWGNEGHVHNYHFTFELHTEFKYEGGEVFSFTGDDDLFVYINKKLALNLGGVHGAQNASVDLDMSAATLGIVKGQTYPLDFFFAERHTSESNFKIETTIACITSIDPPQ